MWGIKATRNFGVHLNSRIQVNSGDFKWISNWNSVLLFSSRLEINSTESDPIHIWAVLLISILFPIPYIVIFLDTISIHFSTKVQLTIVKLDIKLEDKII